MNKNILFLLTFNVLFLNFHYISTMHDSTTHTPEEAFEIANPLPEPNDKYIPFMGNIYEVKITDPKTRKSYVDPDAYLLYCQRQHAANCPAAKPQYYKILAQRLEELKAKKNDK